MFIYIIFLVKLLQRTPNTIYITIFRFNLWFTSIYVAASLKEMTYDFVKLEKFDGGNQWRSQKFYSLDKKIIAKHYFLPVNNFTFHADPKIIRYYLTWDPKSLAKSAVSVFPAEFTQKSAGKSTGKVKSSSNGWDCYKESWSWAWASAQASWGWLLPWGKLHPLVEENLWLIYS